MTLLPILAALLLPLAGWLGHRLVKAFEAKTGIDVPERQEKLIESWIGEGISYAEEKALKAVKAKTDKITGPEKLEVAADYVMELVKRYKLEKKAETWARDKIQNRIESAVNTAR